MKIVWLLCLLCLGGSLKAQVLSDSVSCRLSGRVVSGEDGKPLPGAHIFLGIKRILVAVTDSLGKFDVGKLPAGEQWLKVSFVGFRPLEQKVVLEGHTAVGDISLKALILDEVVVSARPPLTVQKGDTLQFNAAAVHLAEDADLEKLLKKLPGFEIVDGKIMAQGQEVKKITIDGIEYAINDPAAALKNLPAKLVARIKMYDDKSEEAKFSGYDDGSKSRTLNIETRNPNQMKVFGRGELAYGLEKVKDKSYSASVSLNLFDRKRKITFSGNAGRMALNDLPDARYRDEGNKNKNHGLWGNYSSQINKKLQVSGNYRWNANVNNSASLSRQEYLPTGNYESRVYDNESHSNSDNQSHGINFSLDYKINDKNRIRFNPDFTISRGNQESLSWNSSMENGDTLNRTETKAINKNDSKRAGGNFSWMHAFKKTGRTLTFQFSGGYNESNSGDYQHIHEKITERGDSLRFQKNDNERINYSIGTGLSYSEPLTKFARISFNYHFLTSKDQADRHSLAYRDAVFEELIGIDTALTNKSINKQVSQNFGVNYNYHKEKVTLNGGGSLRLMQMENRNRFIGKPDSLVGSNYLDISPRAELSYRMSEKRNVSVNYNGNTSSPSAVQLQDVLNVSNPLQVSKGNPGLKKSYSHHLSMRYTSSEPMNSRFFWANFDVQQTINQISSNVKFIGKDTLIDGYLVSKGGSLTMPVNLNGMWSMNVHTNYSMPVKKIHLDFGGDYSYSHQPSIYDDQQNVTQMHRGQISIGVNTDLSENFDFYCRHATSYSHSRNSSTGKAQNLEETVMANCRWLFWKGFFVGGDYFYTYYWNKTGTVTIQSNNRLNLELGKKFGKKKQAELVFRANDIFRDRSQVHYSVTDLYTRMDSSTSTQDYYMLSFSYRFDRIEKK